ncbi:MAG: restriction endonuclease subunit S [Deltaproteobacteria bacterium]|jgi:type I restriction enzyme S subunit|nr:restriction endonuclease subunit S [Deltaproteobacteria bacterium]
MSDLFVDTPYSLQPIKSLVSINYGKGLAAKIRDEKGKVPVYGSNGIIGYHSKSITKAPVIIIGRKGSVGAVNFSDTNCWPIDTSFYIDEYPDDLEPKWLYHCLTSLEFGIHAQGPKPGIKRDLLYQTKIPVPSLNEQRRIVARIEELTRRAEEARRILREAEEELISFTPALLAKAFRGEL